MVRMPLAKLDDLFAALASRMSLYLPVDNSAGFAEYRKWETGLSLSRAPNTARSAKDFFFPQTESIASFRTEGKNIEVSDDRVESGDFAVFGVRACDVASFSILDRVFLAEPVDTFYRTRREHAVVFSLACSRPESTCFCPLFGIDAASPKGDVTTWIAGDDLFLEPNTERGRAVLEAVGELVSPADDAASACAVEKEKKEIAGILGKLPFARIKTGRFVPENLLPLFNSPEWAQLAEACLGCGTCTFVCPTCQCYDIRDFNTGHGVKRTRCWDSCMYSDFTRMAHGNPRLTQSERFRQRFMHKLVYYPSNNSGVYGCVGCGRCIGKCPVSMNIVKVMKTLGEEK